MIENKQRTKGKIMNDIEQYPKRLTTVEMEKVLIEHRLEMVGAAKRREQLWRFVILALACLGAVSLGFAFIEAVVWAYGKVVGQ